ncbi:MAG: cytochrome c3 family protein [Nitrospirota bacterium]|nr:cytochrome c3 family protein [Nitrospirota bacterium]
MKRRVVFSIMGLFILPTVLLAAEQPSLNPHLKDKDGKTVSCDGCHKTHGKPADGGGMPLLAETEILLCQSCHPADNDHSVDIVPKKALAPKELPLDKDGKVVCSTCHDSHGNSKFPKLLRANAQVLCTMCHIDK